MTDREMLEFSAKAMGLMTTDDMIAIPRAELQQVLEVIARYKSLLVLVIDEDRLHGDVSQAIQALRERLAQPKYTTTSDTPEWRLISPEGKVYLGDSPLRCLRAEQDERIPPEVQIDNIRAAMEEAKAEPSAEPVAGEELPTDEMLLDLAANLIAGYLAEIPKNQQPYFADDAAGCVREINNRLTSSNVLSGDRLIPINVNGCTHTRTAAEWFALSQADYLRAQQPSEQAEPVCVQGKLWLWRNHVDGRPEYWAFENPFPVHDNGDPQTLGEPCGYALLKASRNGRPDVDDEVVIRKIKPPTRTPLTDDEIAAISVECAAAHRGDDISFARAIERAHGIGDKR